MTGGNRDGRVSQYALDKYLSNQLNMGKYLANLSNQHYMGKFLANQLNMGRNLANIYRISMILIGGNRGSGCTLHNYCINDEEETNCKKYWLDTEQIVDKYILDQHIFGGSTLDNFIYLPQVPQPILR